MNNKPKRYRLLKDTLWGSGVFIKSGTVFTADTEHAMCWEDSRLIWYSLDAILSNIGEWFEEINEVTILTHFAHDNMSKYYWFRTLRNKEIPKEKFPPIIEAIEKVLNNETMFDGKGHNWRLTDEDGQSGSIKFIRKPAKYTQEELDKAIVDAFNAAREKDSPWFSWRFDSPKSYLLSLHEKKSI